MDIHCYEHDQGFVLEQFKNGEFDYVDAASEVEETEFFRFIQAKKYLTSLAETYPSPRIKEEVPTWFYLASNLSMRLHGVQSFHAYPYVVRCGGMLNVLGPDVAHKTLHPQTGDVTLNCQGFNDKNDYERQTPCDQDFLRKFSRDTKPDLLETWFNRDAAGLFKKHKVFDPEGIFIGDASYLFVPDNPAYEGSVKMLFDESGHPVDEKRLKNMAPSQAAGCEWKRCYKLVSLLHTDRKRSFCLRVALRVLPGNAHECPILYGMVDQWVEDLGVGVIKRLILDRGFLDGEKIAHCKLKHGIDILIPLKKNMEIYQDALGLMGEASFQSYEPPPREPLEAPRLPQSPPRVRKRELKRQETLEKEKKKLPPLPPEKIRVRSEVAGIEGFRSLESCRVPLNVLINRDVYQDGHQDLWMLLDTKPLDDKKAPQERRQEYTIRVEIEEGHRQLKCFWDLTQFTSRSFSLVMNQIVFVCLAYNLLQIYLKSLDRKALNRKTRPGVLNQLLPTNSVVIIYCQNRFATLSTLEYTEILLTLSEIARKKILEKTRRLRKALSKELQLARPP